MTKKSNFEITIKTFFGRALKNATLKIIDITCLFENKEIILKEEKISKNNEKEFYFKLPNKNYLLQIKKRYSIYETIISNKAIVKLPFLFLLLKKKLLDREELAEKYRWDYDFCYKCKEEHKGMTNIFKCAYCHKHYCKKHRLPEEHSCKGNPKSLASNYRTIFSGKNIKIIND